MKLVTINKRCLNKESFLKDILVNSQIPKMQFCPKCGAVLIQKKKNFGCARCRYSTKEKVKINTSEKIDEKKEVAVIKGKSINTEPVVAEICKKCGHGESYFWTIQTRAGDEAETKFFKCVKCEYTWREYR